MAKLRETLDMLEKREAYLQKKVEKELLVAKQNATKNKRSTSMPSRCIFETEPQRRLLL